MQQESQGQADGEAAGEGGALAKERVSRRGELTDEVGGETSEFDATGCGQMRAVIVVLVGEIGAHDVACDTFLRQSCS